MMKDSTMTIAGASVKLIGDGIALVDSTPTVKGQRMPDGAAKDISYHLVQVYKKQGAEWQVLAARPYVFVQK